MPEKPRSTVTGKPDTADSVAVNVATPPVSEMLGLSTDNVTAGGSSSSLMVVVCCCVPASSPFVTLVTSTITVSSFSSSVSGTALTVTVPLVSPAAMTICVLERV